MTTNRMPARVVSPGQVISKELEARGWSQRDLADIMGRPYQAINEIVKGSKQITPDTARELAMAFGTSLELWMNLEANYRLFLAAQEDKERDIERRSQIYTIAPVAEMVKRGWIKGATDTAGLESQVCKFLGIHSPLEKPSAYAYFRISESRGPQDAAKVAWIKRVEKLAKQQTVGRFNLENLRENIPHLLTFARRAEDAAKIPSTLQDLGVHFLVVPHLPHTYLDGAALFVDDHPVIAVTLRYDRIDWFWFTVLHELAHILLGHSAQVDSLFRKEGEEDLGENDDHDLHRDDETKANELARQWLLDPQSLDTFISMVQPYFSKAQVEAFAAEQQRHPGIVVGQLQHKGVIEYKQMRTMLEKVSPYLEAWVDKPASISKV